MTSPKTYFSVFTENNTPHARKIVEDIVSDFDSNDDSVRVTGLVIDIEFLGMIDVAIELALPCYIFMASNIGFLSLMSFLSTRHDHDQMGSVEFQSFSDTELVHPANLVNSEKSQKILKWLDDQPESSVLFLCFGMGGSFGPEQVKEIATGLEKSEYRFLWTLRVSGLHQSTNTHDDYDPDLFPGGFPERMGERGMICRWAPQVKKFNAFMMVKELGLAAAIESGSGKDNGGLVAAEEIAKAVRYVMDGDQSDEIRKKAMEMAEISKKSLMEGGSSFVSMGKYIDFNF
ncbi:hypothetical protein LWI28_003550 [Acer negundo]|uniref:Uncharacterized protein n=1 Tax=Acer negundo TaxID=4023 RepID=A0AAD5P0K9_ACENE|nr:hypothetical protein LWI28_003550 [Acer negundo]KAK4857289.1 hypothetical protein QYF36_026553 [Acer negundo]